MRQVVLGCLPAGSVPIKLCQIQVRGWKHYQSFLSLPDETKKAITDSFVVPHLASFVVSATLPLCHSASVTRVDPDPRRHLRSITALDDYRPSYLLGSYNVTVRSNKHECLSFPVTSSAQLCRVFADNMRAYQPTGLIVRRTKS